MQLGNGRWEAMQFKSSLQPMQIANLTRHGAFSLLKPDYSFSKQKIRLSFRVISSEAKSFRSKERVMFFFVADGCIRSVSTLDDKVIVERENLLID